LRKHNFCCFEAQGYGKEILGVKRNPGGQVLIFELFYGIDELLPEIK